MDIINDLLSINYIVFFTYLIVFTASFVAIVKLIEQVSIIIQKPVSWVQKKNSDHITLMQLVKNVETLQQKQEQDITTLSESQTNYRKQSIDIQSKLTAAIDNINTKLDVMRKENLDKDIDDMRWEIINIADKLTDGKTIGKETYRHVFKTYNKYEKIIDENDLTNSEVDISMEIIKESYKNFAAE